jgi:AMP deaminase
MGKTDLRTVFMKTKNKIEGRFFAELHRDVSFKRVANNPHREAMEPRLSIYGLNKKEWHDLAHWFVSHKVGHGSRFWAGVCTR